MELQRIFLLIALAVTGYLMILAWNEDYHQAPSVSTTPAQTESPADATAILPATDPSSQGTKVDDNLPIASTPEPVIAGTTEAQPIQVDVGHMSVWIDPVGGDVQRVDLPKYPQTLGQPDLAFVLLDPRNQYEAQSGLIGRDGIDGGGKRPLYKARSQHFSMAPNGKELVVELEYQDASVRVVKRFRFTRDSYLVQIDHQIDNRMMRFWEGQLFAQFRRDSRPPSIDDAGSMGLQPFVGGALFTPDEPYHKLQFDDLSDEPYRQDVQGGYIALVQHYFVSAWIPEPAETNSYQARGVEGKDLFLLGYTSPARQIAPGKTDTFSTKVYFGPKDQRTLSSLSKGLDLTVDYGFLWWIAQPLFRLLELIQGLVGNWGLAIVLLTLIVKVALYPLSAASFRSMAKMRKLQPEMQRLKERYGEDRQKFSQAMMDLYRKEGANPLGGCLPMLLQMPVFLALYWTLLESIELRQAPLAFWIQDLSVMDPYFVLPILMGASMFITQLMQPEPPDPMQAKVMKMMPIMFTFFFLWFPSGLVLYWLVNNLLSILQQWFVNRQIAASGG